MKFRACIHRGSAEIGGSCVELECDGKRLVLDLGLPLESRWDDAIDLPPISGLEEADPSLLGVVVSHSHPDHFGLIPAVSERVPVFVGKAADAVLRAASFFTPAPGLPKATGYLVDKSPIHLGPFCVTPCLTDHSAFDSYGLCIEAADRRLYYSGDLRGHGRKKKTFERLLDSPPADINALLLEGTSLSRPTTSAPITEEDVERRCLEVMRATDGLVLAAYSPQNVDRLVSIYRAARRARRTLVLDLYAASIMDAIGLPTLPQASWDGVRVFLPQSQRVRVMRSQAFARLELIRGHRIYLPEILAKPDRYVLSFRASMSRDLESADLAGAQAIWSMWPGYLETSADLHAFLESKMIPLVVSHSSGHASVADLERLAKAIGAERVVPIHTAVPELYEDHFDNVVRHADGEWWEV